MTDDTTEQPRPLKVFTCYDPRHPMRSCYALVEDAPEPRQKHRAWHLEEENGRKAQQKAIKSRDDEIARLHDAISGYRRDVAAYENEVAGFHGEVQRVETPPASIPLEINRNGYTDEETDDDPDEHDDDWATPARAEGDFDDTEDDTPILPAPSSGLYTPSDPTRFG